MSAKFTKPTVDEVRDYCQERVTAGKPAVDAEAFHDFYESKGWKVGDQAMKDWKAAVRNWEKRDGSGGPVRLRGGRDPTDPRGTLATGQSYLAKRQKGLIDGDP